MWTHVIIGVMATVIVFLATFIIAIATGKLHWGKHFDAQTKRTLHFMELARKYAAMAHVYAEVAEILPPPNGQPEENERSSNEPGVQRSVTADGRRPGESADET